MKFKGSPSGGSRPDTCGRKERAPKNGNNINATAFYNITLYMKGDSEK
jgi:hypothetical protein